MYTKLNNKLNLPVIDRFGYYIDEREIRNCPAGELYPDEPTVFIQWTADSNRPTAKDLRQPVEYKGISYHGAFAWGSSVKRGMTLGLTRDFPVKDGAVQTVEDGQRVGRWLYAAGVFGGLKASELEIGIYEIHSQLPAGPVEDGFGYIRRSIAEKYKAGESVTLGTSRDNHTFWQRIPWDQVADEMLPLILDDCAEASDPAKMLRATPHSYEQKKALFDADPAMLEHPFVANSLNYSAQSYFARLCSSINLRGQYRVAVPTTAPTICWPDHYGQIALDRSPIDSNGSIQAVETEPDPSEEARIAKMDVIQVTIASKKFMSKGCLGIVDDDLLDYDIVICAEDIKMVSSDMGTLRAVRKQHSIALKDAVVPFLVVWDRSATVGVNAIWAKDRMGLDHDGDAVRLIDCTDKPKLWQAIRDLPVGQTPKLPKSRRLISDGDLRAEMIEKSMANLVGMATNVSCGTFMTENRGFLASQLGFKSVETLDARLNFFIKTGTDGYKCDVDQKAVEKEVAIIQNAIRRLYGVSAPWTGWSGSQWAFTLGLPPIILAVIQPDEDLVEYVDLDGIPMAWSGMAVDFPRYIVYGEDEPRKLEEHELKLGIWPFMDGTVAQIARIALPYIMPNWNETVQIRPLTAFRSWAPRKEQYEGEAEEIQFWFNARVGRVNWTDVKSIAEFKLQFQERLAETNIPKWDMACALWHVAHSSRGKDASAASVFIGFPDECMQIVAEKPGAAVKEITLTGLNYQLPGFVAGEIKDIRIEDVTTMKSGKKIVRRVICGKVNGQVAPRDPAYPKDLIAFVAANVDQPEVGLYDILRIQPFGQASWKAVLA